MELPLIASDLPGVRYYARDAAVYIARQDVHETVQAIAEIARFPGAARRVVLRVEIQDHGLPGVVGQPVPLARLIGQGKGWRLTADVDDGHLSLPRVRFTQ